MDATTKGSCLFSGERQPQACPLACFSGYAVSLLHLLSFQSASPWRWPVGTSVCIHYECICKQQQPHPAPTNSSDVNSHSGVLGDSMAIQPLFADERWSRIRSSAPPKNWLTALHRHGFPFDAMPSTDPVQDLVGIGQFAGADQCDLLSLTTWLASTLRSKGTKDARMADRGGPLLWPPIQLSSERVKFDTSCLGRVSETHVYGKGHGSADSGPLSIRAAFSSLQLNAWLATSPSSSCVRGYRSGSRIRSTSRVGGISRTNLATFYGGR